MDTSSQTTYLYVLNKHFRKIAHPRDNSNRFGYQIELENVPSIDKLIRVTSDCLNNMGYSVFFDIGADEDMPTSKTVLLAAVDDSTYAWAEIHVSWFLPDHDALISMDFDQGNALAEDWYEE